MNGREKGKKVSIWPIPAQALRKFFFVFFRGNRKKEKRPSLDFL